MAHSIPYVLSPSSLKTALEKIRSAATPPRVTKDFVNSVLQIKGGTGDAIAPFLKRIGFVASDGSPTDLYKRFRNPASGGVSIADGMRIGYKDLLAANEYFHKLNDKELKALIVQVTGLEADNRVTSAIFGTLKILMSYANFEDSQEIEARAGTTDDSVASEKERRAERVGAAAGGVGLNLSYTINLNLPATSDQAVFNAIFRSLKEHILSNE